MACPTVRYTDREVTQNEIANFQTWWTEQLAQYGTNVYYYSKGYVLSGHDFLYGEDLDQPFASPKEIIIGMNITNDASMLSKFGILLDSDATAWIPIELFQNVFGFDEEPKSGDVIELHEVGVDRPGGRGAPKYEITQRDDDQFPAGINPLTGHYVWFVKLKRFEYSHEPGVEPEPGTVPVDDTTQTEAAVSAQNLYTSGGDSVYGNY